MREEWLRAARQGGVNRLLNSCYREESRVLANEHVFSTIKITPRLSSQAPTFRLKTDDNLFIFRRQLARARDSIWGTWSPIASAELYSPHKKEGAPFANGQRGS
ncbi:MAG: hypothetical protein DMG96_27000 [Acidobacteria bacterium]|nr:MAG: hypothetical protein DMG96_27000 [Acidobacteriota bacterium]